VRYRLGAFAKGSAEASAEGHFTHVYVDRETRRPKALPHAWRDALATLSD
jgi:acyl-CoA thioester hydrolase